MQHSHEGLDRPGEGPYGNLFAPLRYRDFRVLWAGMTVSLVGDGVFLISIAWETYALWNAPIALSIVGIGMTVPTIAFLLVGGVVSDRRDRRGVLAPAGGLPAVAVARLAGPLPSGAPPLSGVRLLLAGYRGGTTPFTP